MLRIINRFNLGGITYNVSYLSRYLPEEYETLLIGGPEEENEESSLFIPHSLGLQPQIIPEMRRSLNPFKDFLAYQKIKEIIREFRPDIVHTHASKAGAVGRLAALSCGVPVIVHTFHGHVFHGYFSPVKTRIFKSLESFLARKSSAIVAISQIQKKELCEIHRVCEAEKTHVIPLGFDLERFRTDQAEKRNSFRHTFGIAEEEMAIGIIGRLAPIKNHFLFIDTVAEAMQRSAKKLRAVIVGDGEMRAQLESYIAQKGLKHGSGKNKEEFILCGWVKEADWALAGLDLLCLSSKNEGTPVSLIEAQAARKFIVSTNVGGIEDILHKDCGLLSSREDAEAFKQNLLYAIDHFAELSQKAGVAQQEVIDKFSYKRLCSDMDQLYRKLLSRK